MSRTTALDSLSPFTKVLKLENHVLVAQENPNYKNKKQEPFTVQPLAESKPVREAVTNK